MQLVDDDAMLMPGCPGVVVCADPLFPAPLRGAPSPPEKLWYAGRLPLPDERIVALVGARAASRAGCDLAAQFAAGLADAGFAVVSGGALGIDAAAHLGALERGGATFAILGCGTDVVYPDRHAELFARIVKRGGLLAEYPPGTPPRRGHFPARNRLIASLGEAVIIVEAALRSGALITARRAHRLGRPLLAVPGSPGTDELIRSGSAVAVLTCDDVRRSLAGEGLGARPSPSALSASVASEPGAGGRFSAVLAGIDRGFDLPPDLCKHLGMALPSLLAVLAEAELEGYVRRAAGNSYEVIRT